MREQTEHTAAIDGQDNIDQMTVSGATGERLKKELKQKMSQINRSKLKEESMLTEQTSYNYVGFVLWTAAMCFLVLLIRELLQADFGSDLQADDQEETL